MRGALGRPRRRWTKPKKAKPTAEEKAMATLRELARPRGAAVAEAGSGDVAPMVAAHDGETEGRS